MPTIGAYTAFGLGAESTHGTAVARTNWLPARAWGLQRRLELVPRAHLGISNATAVMRRTVYPSQDYSNGPVSHDGSYDDSTALLMYYGFGAVVDAGVGPYTHTYTLAGPALLGFTAEGKKGHGANAKSEVFEGCLIARQTYRVQTGKILEISNEIIAETSAGEAAQGTPTYATAAEAIAYNHWGAFTFDSVARTLISLEWTIDRMISERLRLGSLNSPLPAPTGFTRVTGRMVVEHGDGGVWYSKHLAQTQGDGTITATGSGGSLAMTFQNMVLMKRDNEVSDPGVNQESYDFECFSDGTDLGCKAILTNTNALYSDNS